MGTNVTASVAYAHASRARALHNASTAARYPARTCIVCAAVLVVLAMSTQAVAEEELGFTAEHMIEAQMDARYMALPEIELPTSDTGRTRFGTGYMTTSGGPTTSANLLLDVQRYKPLAKHERWAVVLGGFVDLIQFDGTGGPVTIDPNFLSTSPVDTPFAADVLDVSGNALHMGASVAAARQISASSAWQAGIMLEHYDVDEYKVAFRTDGPARFEGELDYAGTYDSVTPFVAFRHVFPRRSERYTFSSRALLAWPVPRRGFHGQISGPGFRVEGDSETAGTGRHIPDGFAGVGFAIESAARRWRVDVGASLWLYLAENKGHEGVDPPLFVYVNLPLD